MMNELAQVTGARYSTSILRCPTGVYKLVGSVPAQLADDRWKTEQEAIDALVAIGVTRFQLANCRWYGE